MRFPDSAGLLLTIVDGFRKNETMMVQTFDNYHYPFGDFVEKIQAEDSTPADSGNWIKAPRLYLIAGHKEKISLVRQAWRTKIQKAFGKILLHESVLEKTRQKVNTRESYCLESFYWLYLSEGITTDKIHYPREWKSENGDFVLLAFYWTLNPDENPLDIIEQVISFWLDREQPALKGYQCLTRSFILQNMVGRKVLATIPDRQGDWGMLLEGGWFLPLTDDFAVGLSKLNSSHIHQWTLGEIEEILLNPVYAFGYAYQHPDLVLECFYVFLYSLATMDEDRFVNIDLEFVYRRFCNYMGEHICPYILVKEKILEVNEWIKCLSKILDDIREYLKGKEEIGISKNIFLMMRNRHAYLPTVLRFIREELDMDTSHSTALDWVYWQNQLDNLTTVNDSYEKGRRLEELMQYLLSTVSGLKVTDIRAKKGRAEVDIFCCNISYDSYLWKLGALILIECKNRKEKVGVADIRNLVPTMEAKGIKGAMIVSTAGFSTVAMQEIEHQLCGGKIIIPIHLQDLRKVGKEKSSYELIREKIDNVKSILADDYRQLYF